MPEVFQAGVPLSLPSNKIIAQGPANVCFSPSFCCWLYLHYWNFAHFFFFSFQKADLSFACAVLPHNNNPYFCGNTGESRVLSGTFKSLQFHNCQTEGDLQTEGPKVQVFYHNAFYRLETKSIHRQTHFTPSSLKEKLIWYFVRATHIDKQRPQSSLLMTVRLWCENLSQSSTHCKCIPAWQAWNCSNSVFYYVVNWPSTIKRQHKRTAWIIPQLFLGFFRDLMLPTFGPCEFCS